MNSLTANTRGQYLVNCDEIQNVNYSAGRSKVRGVYEQLRAFKKNHGNASVKSIIVHVGTNHPLQENTVDVANKICRLLVHTSTEFPNTSIYFSAILPKFGRSFNRMINYVNNEVFNLCLDNLKMEFIWRINSAVNHDLNYDFFWKDKIHTSNIGLRQLPKG